MSGSEINLNREAVTEDSPSSQASHLTYLSLEEFDLAFLFAL